MMMILSTYSFPLIVKAAEEPLGLYIQPGRVDHKVVCQLLSEDRAAMTGIIFDPTQNDVHEELRIEIGKRNLEAVLDPKMMELASLGGFSGQRTNLPWAGDKLYVPSDLRGRNADAVADAIAQFVALHGYSALLAPSHYLENGADDQWCEVDKPADEQTQRPTGQGRLQKSCDILSACHLDKGLL